jgi:3-methyladenine DNA glycosylase AlkD
MVIMTYIEVMAALDKAGTAKNRKVYLRHGARKPLFGVSFAILRDLARKNNNNHPLAIQLWKSGNYDACLLACQVADPGKVSNSLTEAWVMYLYNYVLSNEFSVLISRSPLAKEKAELWIGSKKEYVSRTGWMILARLVEDQTLPDDYFDPYLVTIEKEIHQSPNRTRDAMNTALINIGLRHGLTSKCLDISARVGKVEVDHGETGCKTPDAGEYIKKTLAYRAKKKNKS